MTRPFTGDAPEPILYVSLKPCPLKLHEAVRDFRHRLGIERVTLVEKKSRALHFCRLADYRGEGLRAGCPRSRGRSR